MAYYIPRSALYIAGMGTLLTHTENGFGAIANILLIIGAGGAFNAILKSKWAGGHAGGDPSNMHMHPILLAWLVALILASRRFYLRFVAMMAPPRLLRSCCCSYPDVSSGDHCDCHNSGAIGCTIVTDSLFWLVKQYCGAGAE